MNPNTIATLLEAPGRIRIKNANKTAILVSARADFAARMAVAEGRWPRKDFLELARALDADVIDHSFVENKWHWRLLRSIVGMPATQACIVFLRRGRYERIFSDGEHIGIPLALLLRLSHRRIRHVMIGHLLTTRTKQLVFRLLKPQQRIDVVLLHATRQREQVCQQLGFSRDQVKLIPYQVDPTFWKPTATAVSEPLIATAGLEYRDYRTLVEAVRGLPVRLVIAAASQWSQHKNSLREAALPPNVEVVSLAYQSLRDLYAQARFVVVPLRPVENQAGVTTILEAMAMGKAVIATATVGQRDVVRGRLWSDSGSGPVQGGPAVFGVPAALAERETGLVVVPSDTVALRRAIEHLLRQPSEALEMGAAGRLLTEDVMSLDAFVERVVASLEPEQAARPVPV